VAWRGVGVLQTFMDASRLTHALLLHARVPGAWKSISLACATHHALIAAQVIRTAEALEPRREAPSSSSVNHQVRAWKRRTSLAPGPCRLYPPRAQNLELETWRVGRLESTKLGCVRKCGVLLPRRFPFLRVYCNVNLHRTCYICAEKCIVV